MFDLTYHVLYTMLMLQLKEDDDVYDVVDQDDYDKMVESRRQRDDFVVDDGMNMCIYVHMLDDVCIPIQI
jgi:hypothetical protein